MLNLKQLLKSKTFCKIALISLGSIAVLGLALLAWTFLDKLSPISRAVCQQKVKQTTEVIKQANYCAQDSDCIIVKSWGCGNDLVNQERRNGVKQKIKLLNKWCVLPPVICPEPTVSFKCLSAKCEFVEEKTKGEVYQQEVIIPVYQINQTPQLYVGKLISVSGKILMSEMTYSGIFPEPGGRVWEIFLQSEGASIALDIKNFTQDYESFQEQYNQKQVKVKAKVRQKADYNPFLETEDINVVQSVTISTDKTEYQPSEIIEIILVNNSQDSIDIKDEQYISEGVADLEKKAGDSWQKINLIAIPRPITNRKLLPGESYTYKWGQFIGFETKASGGVYRFKFSVGAEENILVSYSNEFTIKVQVGQRVDDFDLAQRVLIEYFSLLNEGKYTEAVKFHGSGYNYMNYALKLDLSNPANYPELLKRGCGFLVCENINIIKKEQVSTNEFVFTVQFVYDNGEIVKSYPYCCGEEPPEGVANVPKTEFEYKVKKVGANFFVTTPLLYIP